jgi:hypothetical protein
MLPPVIDDPEEFVPDTLPEADLVLSCAEHAGVAQLIPEVVRRCGAGSVIACIDDEAWLPRGLARQLRGWLADMHVTCVTPKPLCSLTEEDYGTGRRKRESYRDPVIAEFARRFGRPELVLSIDESGKTVVGVEVRRDAVCGSGRFVAEGLVGVPVEEAVEKAGLLHHHYPCLAGMEVDADYGDTLMHVSGNIIRDGVGEQVRPFVEVRYIVP